jgi:succinate-acetate transporter protein
MVNSLIIQQTFFLEFMLLAVKVHTEVVNLCWFIGFHGLQAIQAAYNLRLEMVIEGRLLTRGSTPPTC